jgi:hypothetical protein
MPYGGPGMPYGGPPAPRPVDPVDRKAQTALVMGLVAAPFCCAPLGIFGAITGVQAMNMAKARGDSAPAKAVAAIVLGALSVVFLIGTLTAYKLDQRRKAERIAEAEEKVKGKLEGDRLSKDVACALAEKQLLKGLHDGSTVVDDVHCKGAWEGDDTSGKLAGVSARIGGTDKTFDVCFARAHRWFVLASVPPGSPCPKDVAADHRDDRKLSAEELEKEEDDLRASAQSAIDEAVLAALEKKLDAAEKLAARREHSETKCGKITGSEEERIVPTVDLAFLKEKDADSPWRFLTSEPLRRALDDKRSIADRAKDARTIGGRYLVVFVSEERALPVVMKSQKGYVGGGFDGWMLVVDTDKDAVVCEADFAFENEKTIAVGKWAGDKSIDKALREDLARAYEKGAGTALSKLSDGKLRLR